MISERRLARRALNYAQEQANFYRGGTSRDDQEIADAYEEFADNTDIDELCILWRGGPPKDRSEAERWVDDLVGVI